MARQAWRERFTLGEYQRRILSEKVLYVNSVNRRSSFEAKLSADWPFTDRCPASHALPQCVAQVFRNKTGERLALDHDFPPHPAKAKGTRFYTNGILLDRDGLIEKVMPNLDRLHISMPGLDRKNYFEVFKVDKAEKVLRGLLKLAEYKKATGFPKKVFLELRINRPLDVVVQDDGMQKLKPYIEQGTFLFGVTIENYESHEREYDGIDDVAREPDNGPYRPMPTAFLQSGDSAGRACAGV